MSDNPLEDKDLAEIIGASPEDLADPVADPGAQAPAPGAKPDPLAAARRVQADQVSLAMRKAKALIEDGLAKDDLTNPMWTLAMRQRIARALGVSEKRVTWLVRHKLKMQGGLEAARRRGAGLPVPNDPRHTVPEGEAPETSTRLWRWNILDLFDRMMQVFDAVDDRDTKDEDEVNDEPIDPMDPRATWIAWRVFLAAAFGLDRSELDYDHAKEDGDPGRVLPAYPGVDAPGCPRGAAGVHMGASVQEIFELCTGRKTWPWVQAKIVSLIVGRRGGKSYITAIIGIYLACCRRYRLKLGTKGMVMILARDREQAGVIRGYILAFLKALPELREMFADDPTQKLIELKNGITIEVKAAGEAGTRGYTVVAVLADEIAFWPTDPESAKQDKKVMRALRPAMLGIKNAMIVMLSSPYAKRGELYENFRRYFGLDDQTRGFVWNADTLTMRPSNDPELLEEIQSEYEEDPESAKAEYGAHFRSDLENIYSRTAIESVCVPGRFEEGYVSGRRYRAFVDPSGGSSDSYVLAIAYDDKRVYGDEKVDVPVLAKVIGWEPKFDPEEVSKQVVEICKQFHITGVTGDAYGGEWPRDPLRKRGIAYELADKTRSELYLDFLPVVNSGRCELLDPQHHRKAVNQFVNLERRVGRTGKDSVDHPPGSHDDYSNAIAGAMVGCTASTALTECTW